MICNHNGRFIDPDDLLVSGQDGGWLYGDTLFETMKAKDGQIRFLQQHLDRMAASADMLDFPFDRSTIHDALDAAIQQFGSATSRVRLTVSRGRFGSLQFPPAENGHFLIQVAPAGEPTEDEYRDGISCVLAPNRRVNPLSHLPQMKRGNYADCLYAANYARDKGAREALFVTRQGLLLEGATSNIFLVRDGALVTPILGELVLRGIIRDQVITQAGEWGVRVETREIVLDELFSADEAFITNSLIDILPVAEVDGQTIDTGPVTQKFLAALQNCRKAT